MSEVAREFSRAAGSGWLPGSLSLLVVALSLVLVVQREVSRGALSAERERRARRASAVVVPLLLCAALTLGSRLLEFVT
jgi:hypothetical protein